MRVSTAASSCSFAAAATTVCGLAHASTSAAPGSEPTCPAAPAVPHQPHCCSSEPCSGQLGNIQQPRLCIHHGHDAASASHANDAAYGHDVSSNADAYAIANDYGKLLAPAAVEWNKLRFTAPAVQHGRSGFLATHSSSTPWQARVLATLSSSTPWSLA